MPATRLHSLQRYELILTAVQENRVVTVPDMATQCRASEMTIRRDFDHLGDLGLLVRTHGGATLPDALVGKKIDVIEPRVDERTQQNRRAKRAMAVAALSFIERQQTIALDIGSSSFELASLLRESPVRIFTTSLKIAVHLSDCQPRVYVPGGEIHGSEPSIIGARASEDLGRFMFDVAFIGVSGITPEGLYDYSLEDTEIKWTMIERSQKTVALIDSSKFNHQSVAQVSPLNNIDILITDQEPPVELRAALTVAGVEICIAASQIV